MTKCIICNKPILLSNDPRLVVGKINRCYCTDVPMNFTPEELNEIDRLVYLKMKKYEKYDIRLLGSKPRKKLKLLQSINNKFKEVKK